MAGMEAVLSLRRRLSRRTVLGATLSAGSLAVAYGALGGRLNPFTVKSQPLDTDAISRESVRVSHLLRRAGFGATREEHEYFQSLGLNGSIEALLAYETIDDEEAMQLAAQVPADRTPALWWLVLMANTRRPLQEKMTLFWHGLLTSQLSVVRDPQAMLAQNQLLRTHALDAFPSILRAITFDPAMMVYLDIDGSERRAPNENYARELMELFALGVGNFSEQDVREASRAFTGWQVPRTRGANNLPQLGEPVFRPQRFDDGIKTVFGRSGNFRPEDIIDLVVERPESSYYITRRLFSFFAYPNPADADLKALVAAYEGSGRSIRAVVEAILRSEAFYSPRAYRAIVKSPVEYVVSAAKVLGVQRELPQALAAGANRDGRLAAMGQTLFEPPSVAGWPGNAAWLNSTTLLARLNFINQLTAGGRAAANRPAPRQPVQTAPSTPLGTAEEAMGHYLALALDDNVSREARELLLEAAGGPAAELSPERLRTLASLVLSSPQFHLS